MTTPQPWDFSLPPPIFLSASVPDRDAHLYVPDRVAIREAVRAVVAVIVPRHSLIFGGHPAISPLIWEAADSLGLSDRVYIYQSRLFAPDVPPEAYCFQGLNRLVWTPIVSAAPKSIERKESLRVMREMMIQRRVTDERKAFDPFAPADFPEYAAGIFIGGMDGVEDEWSLFRKHYAKRPAFLIASTAGAAQRLLEKPDNRLLYSPDELLMLRMERRYRHLFLTLMP